MKTSVVFPLSSNGFRYSQRKTITPVAAKKFLKKDTVQRHEQDFDIYKLEIVKNWPAITVKKFLES